LGVGGWGLAGEEGDWGLGGGRTPAHRRQGFQLCFILEPRRSGRRADGAEARALGPGSLSPANAPGRRGLARSVRDFASFEPRLLNNAPPGLRNAWRLACVRPIPNPHPPIPSLASGQSPTPNRSPPPCPANPQPPTAHPLLVRPIPNPQPPIPLFLFFVAFGGGGAELGRGLGSRRTSNPSRPPET
jgi:hypothetical protein